MLEINLISASEEETAVISFEVDFNVSTQHMHSLSQLGPSGSQIIG